MRCFVQDLTFMRFLGRPFDGHQRHVHSAAAATESSPAGSCHFSCSIGSTWLLKECTGRRYSSRQIIYIIYIHNLYIHDEMMFRSSAVQLEFAGSNFNEVPQN